MARNGIVVIGSLNVDHVLHVPRFVQPGETLHSSHYVTGLGGKGFNQCLATRRLAGSPRTVVTMVGRVGGDAGGKLFEQALLDEKIVDATTRVQGTMSGAAFVSVDPQGQNSILLAGGANLTMTPDALDCSVFQEAAIVIMQLEIPISTVAEAARLAVASGTKVILNPAPCQPLLPELLTQIDYLVLNETEAKQLTTNQPASSSAWSRATKLLDAGVRQAVVITQGSGPTIAAYRDHSGGQRVCEVTPPTVAQPVDTTGAGDAFIGALAARLLESNFQAKMEDLLTFSNGAGALTTMVRGAASSIPTRAKLDQYLIAGP